jgi:ribose/xylose/arabinose/galactoside ABC-type transport system permease subunit
LLLKQEFHPNAVRFAIKLKWFRRQSLVFLNDFTKRSLELPFFQKYGRYIFLVILVVVAVIISSPFASLQNIQNVLTNAASLGMAALGQTFVILTAGLNLSVGSLMGTVAVMATAFQASNGWLALIFGSLAGVLLLIVCMNLILLLGLPTMPSRW